MPVIAVTSIFQAYHSCILLHATLGDDFGRRHGPQGNTCTAGFAFFLDGTITIYSDCVMRAIKMKACRARKMPLTESDRAHLPRDFKPPH